MSNMSVWGGPPAIQQTIICFAFAAGAPAAWLRARSTSSMLTPQRDAPPMRRKSRRGIVIMDVLLVVRSLRERTCQHKECAGY